MGLFEKFNKGLRKTRNSMSGAIDTMLYGKNEIDDELYEDLEEILQKRSGISLEKALQLYFRWIAECSDEFAKWIKEIKLI